MKSIFHYWDNRVNKKIYKWNHTLALHSDFVESYNDNHVGLGPFGDDESIHNYPLGNPKCNLKQYERKYFMHTSYLVDRLTDHGVKNWSKTPLPVKVHLVEEHFMEEVHFHIMCIIFIIWSLGIPYNTSPLSPNQLGNQFIGTILNSDYVIYTILFLLIYEALYQYSLIRDQKSDVQLLLKSRYEIRKKRKDKAKALHENPYFRTSIQNLKTFMNAWPKKDYAWSTEFQPLPVNRTKHCLKYEYLHHIRPIMMMEDNDLSASLNLNTGVLTYDDHFPSEVVNTFSRYDEIIHYIRYDDCKVVFHFNPEVTTSAKFFDNVSSVSELTELLFHKLLDSKFVVTEKSRSLSAVDTTPSVADIYKFRNNHFTYVSLNMKTGEVNTEYNNPLSATAESIRMTDPNGTGISDPAYYQNFTRTVIRPYLARLQELR